MGLGGDDSYVLTSPGGSTYELASFIRAEDGPDFGDSWMEAQYAQSPAADGGQFAFESIGPRTMRFPLLVPSGVGDPITARSVQKWEQNFRLAARPGGAYVDILPAEATAAVRFDVLSGRWKPDYKIRHQEIGVRLGTLELDIGPQPFGYLPTEIILASAASVGLPGKLTFSAGSILGDVPGIGELHIAPTAATGYPASGANWQPDALMWSLAGRPSFTAHWPAGSIVRILAGTLTGQPFVPGSQALDIYASVTTWQVAAQIQLATALEPAFRGRHRIFALARIGPSQLLPWYLSADVAPIGAGIALASAAPIATIAPAVASGAPGGYGAQPSPAFTVLDLGELAVPIIGSGITARSDIRIWASPATTNVGVGTPIVSLGGVFLLPLDAPAGVMPRGLVQPTITDAANYVQTWFHADTNGRMYLSGDGVGAPTNTPYANPHLYYRGQLPLVGGSTIQLDLFAAARKRIATTSEPLIYSGPLQAFASLSYRPRFAFARGI
jgi:hypothetical protein